MVISQDASVSAELFTSCSVYGLCLQVNRFAVQVEVAFDPCTCAVTSVAKGKVCLLGFVGAGCLAYGLVEHVNINRLGNPSNKDYGK